MVTGVGIFICYIMGLSSYGFCRVDIHVLKCSPLLYGLFMMYLNIQSKVNPR
jgi:hypothetical protein